MSQFLDALKQAANWTRTENGALAHRSTLSACLDLFAAAGALRGAPGAQIRSLFDRAFAENPRFAMKILFYARDIRGGLGERRFFRIILRHLANHEPRALRRNLRYIPEYGRWDDVLVLLETPCRQDAVRLIRTQLAADRAALARGEPVSLLAKWLPSTNASSRHTVNLARQLARALGMCERDYRKTLVALRRKINILENYLSTRDYSFDYETQPSQALLRHCEAFFRNDGPRYNAFLEAVASGHATLHTATLTPYDIIRPCYRDGLGSTPPPGWEETRRAIDVTWRAQEDFTGDENAIVVMDGSWSMYPWFETWVEPYEDAPAPIEVASSLAIYFAERNNGPFRNHFITFSKEPQLVEIKGADLMEKVLCVNDYDEPSNTDLERVFRLLLQAAQAQHMSQKDLPSRIYIISDMEFDCCVENGNQTLFQAAKQLFQAAGYRLPQVVFWNVACRTGQRPVTMHESGALLVSGTSPRVFRMLRNGEFCDPYSFMHSVLRSKRYRPIGA